MDTDRHIETNSHSTASNKNKKYTKSQKSGSIRLKSKRKTESELKPVKKSSTDNCAIFVVFFYEAVDDPKRMEEW